METTRTPTRKNAIRFVVWVCGIAAYVIATAYLIFFAVAAGFNHFWDLLLEVIVGLGVWLFLARQFVVHGRKRLRLVLLPLIVLIGLAVLWELAVNGGNTY